jgi:hypothetical protein
LRNMQLIQRSHSFDLDQHFFSNQYICKELSDKNTIKKTCI